MVRAWSDGSDVIRPQDIFSSPTGIAMAILRGDPTRAYPYIHKIVTDSNGTFTSVTASEIRASRRLVEDEGLAPCNSASAAVAGLARLAKEGAIQKDATILVNLTGSDPTAAADNSKGHRLVRIEDKWLLEGPVPERIRVLWDTR
jgi:threonine synthase